MMPISFIETSGWFTWSWNARNFCMIFHFYSFNNFFFVPLNSLMHFNVNDMLGTKKKYRSCVIEVLAKKKSQSISTNKKVMSQKSILNYDKLILFCYVIVVFAAWSFSCHGLSFIFLEQGFLISEREEKIIRLIWILCLIHWRHTSSLIISITHFESFLCSLKIRRNLFNFLRKKMMY